MFIPSKVQAELMSIRALWYKANLGTETVTIASGIWQLDGIEVEFES